ACRNRCAYFGVRCAPGPSPMGQRTVSVPLVEPARLQCCPHPAAVGAQRGLSVREGLRARESTGPVLERSSAPARDRLDMPCTARRSNHHEFGLLAIRPLSVNITAAEAWAHLPLRVGKTTGGRTLTGPPPTSWPPPRPGLCGSRRSAARCGGRGGG